MSHKAIRAAWHADVTPAARKLVLIYLADSLNEETGQLNPSVTTVADACGLSPRQAQRHLHDLGRMGLLQVIGNHFGGHQKASRRYRLNLPKVIHTGDTHDRGDMHDTGDTDDANGCHPRHEGVTSMTQTGVMDVTQTRREPEKNKKGTRNKERARTDSIECPPDVDQKVWSDFLAVRKAKRAPMTGTALEGIKREATKAGLTLQEALTRCIEWTWQGFDAGWYAKRMGSTQNKQVALEQRNRAVVAQWLAGQGGGGSHEPTPSPHCRSLSSHF